MALAGQQHNILRTRLSQRRFNRRLAVVNFLRRRTGLQNLGTNISRHFVARIVVRYINHVGIGRGLRAHFSAFAAVAVATTAKHHSQTTTLRQVRAQCLQRIGQRIRRVRIININRRTGLRATDKLHAPARRVQHIARVKQRRIIKPKGLPNSQRHSQILNLKITDKRHADRAALAV